jgi:hypothetical protein
VTGALAAGDRVIVRGGERLRPGQAVTVANTAAPVKSVAAAVKPKG